MFEDINKVKERHAAIEVMYFSKTMRDFIEHYFLRSII